jgi:hypothetical protein
MANFSSLFSNVNSCRFHFYFDFPICRQAGVNERLTQGYHPSNEGLHAVPNLRFWFDFHFHFNFDFNFDFPAYRQAGILIYANLRLPGLL